MSETHVLKISVNSFEFQITSRPLQLNIVSFIHKYQILGSKKKNMLTSSSRKEKEREIKERNIQMLLSKFVLLVWRIYEKKKKQRPSFRKPVLDLFILTMTISD